MPSPIATQAQVALCPHGGSVQVAPQQVRVRLSGQVLLLQQDLGSVTGCPFQVPVGPAVKAQPCVRVTFMTGALRVRASGKPVLLKSSPGLCQSAEQIPQGPPNSINDQLRVRGS